MTLSWSRRARADRRAISAYNLGPYGDNIYAAIRWDDRRVARAEQAARVPNQGHRPRELRDDPNPSYANVLEVLVKRYRIIYQVLGPQAIKVLRVFEGHRLLFPEDLG
jgi:plasmid stabilization system protein ParE